MLAHVHTAALRGVESFLVRVEVNLSSGLPAFTVVGLPHGAVRESRDRVTAALRNSGFPLLNRRITVNLAPGDVRKEGTAFDLPIAVGLLAAGGGILLFMSLAAGEPFSFDASAVSLKSALALIYLITFGAMVAYAAYIWLLTVVSPAKATTYAYVNPVVAMFLGWALADEPLTFRSLGAAAIILGAVVLITTEARTHQAENKP